MCEISDPNVTKSAHRALTERKVQRVAGGCNVWVDGATCEWKGQRMGGRCKVWVEGAAYGGKAREDQMR